MTRMLLLGAGILWLVWGVGCSNGLMGPRMPHASGRPPQMVAPPSRHPIASQPTLAPGQAASSIRVLPFAALPPYTVVQTQNGLMASGGFAIQGGPQTLNLLAANGHFVDGRPVPLLQRETKLPSAGGSKLRQQAIRAAELGRPTSNAQVSDLPSTPQEDLKYRGGRTIRDLSYVNLYVGGQDSWDPQDWRSIDKMLAAAMADAHLNNVIVQYFGNKSISSTFKKSFFLSGWRPQFVAKGDIERQVRGLHSGGAFSSLDLPNTLVNFILPRGTILGDPNGGEQLALSNKTIPQEEAEDSSGGLGGYHGSVHIGSATVYYSTAVYSERLPNGGTNGIPVYDQNWKNVVATVYHELQEARTDPDVDDAIRDGTTNGTRFLGWTSDSGLEIGDYPIAEARQLKHVFVEVPLADGSGLVPVQLQYSNAVHGPEGPIPYPHGMEPPPGTPPITPSPGPTPTQPLTPITTDPELARVIAQWNQLEDFIKKAIVRLANSK